MCLLSVKLLTTHGSFSFDNKINQLIRHTIEKIEITKPFLLEESSVVQKNVKMIKEITPSYSHYELEKCYMRI